MTHDWKTKTAIRDGSSSGRIVVDWTEAEDFLHAAPPSLDGPNNWEAFRMDQRWPTPNHMRSAADALDRLAIPKYGDILRWVADACDRALPNRAAARAEGDTP